MINFIDIPTVVYFFCCLVSAYGFGLFAWWWRRVGSATEVYAYITFLFFGVGTTSAIGIYSRYLHEISEPKYHLFVDSFWWSIGPLSVLGVLTAITVRMTRRVLVLRYGTRDQINRELRLMTCPHCGKPCPRWEAQELNKAKGERE